VGLNIPTGIPLVYELTDDLKPIKHYYLGDPEKIQAAIQSVADQLKNVLADSSRLVSPSHEIDDEVMLCCPAETPSRIGPMPYKKLTYCNTYFYS
jgi:hypothetical protein